ncbi:MAG: hypothetical protein C0625_06830 [Arcobacter sp.]|mgnify:CR=1 FL=1|nr:MAG: hypothetical protein C0625_06830 [Arcobacter sp.]
MFKIFISSIILFASLNAITFNEKIINIIGYNEYSQNKGLIDHLFSNKEAYYKNGSLNYLVVMEKLKLNGLLKMAYSEPQDLIITFNINYDPIKSIKIISDSLKALGYYHYFTKHLLYDQNSNLTWTINLKTEAAIDPLMLSKELSNHNCQFIDIRKEGYIKWMYTIDTSDSIISKAELISSGERVDFRKPLKPYFIKVEGSKNLNILSKPGNQWFPQIVFYDKHLNILDIVKEDNKYDSLQLEIPEETTYIKINDIYTLTNIKRGLSVIIKE